MVRPAHRHKPLAPTHGRPRGKATHNEAGPSLRLFCLFFSPFFCLCLIFSLWLLRLFHFSLSPSLLYLLILFCLFFFYASSSYPSHLRTFFMSFAPFLCSSATLFSSSYIRLYFVCILFSLPLHLPSPPPFASRLLFLLHPVPLLFLSAPSPHSVFFPLFPSHFPLSASSSPLSPELCHDRRRGFARILPFRRLSPRIQSHGNTERVC